MTRKKKIGLSIAFVLVVWTIIDFIRERNTEPSTFVGVL